MTSLKELACITEPKTTFYIYDNDGKELAFIAPRGEQSIFDAVCASEYADYEVVLISAFTHSMRIRIDWLGLCVA